MASTTLGVFTASSIRAWEEMGPQGINGRTLSSVTGSENAQGEAEGRAHLELRVNAVEALGVLRQLGADVLGADEDALQVAPGPLDLKPDGDDGVRRGQLLLPARHLLQEVGQVLGRHQVLQLYLVVFQGLHQHLVRLEHHGARAWVRLVLELHGGPRGIQGFQHLSGDTETASLGGGCEGPRRTRNGALL